MIRFCLLYCFLICLALIQPNSASAGGKLLHEVHYSSLEPGLPGREYIALSEVAVKMEKNSNMEILLESTAYQDNAPLTRLRIVALERAISTRRLLLTKGVNLQRIHVRVKDAEDKKGNVLRIYELER